MRIKPNNKEIIFQSPPRRFDEVNLHFCKKALLVSKKLKWKKNLICVALLSFIANFLYYLCFILLKTDNSLLVLVKGLIANSPESIYYLVPSIIPLVYFILFGILISKRPHFYVTFFLSLIFISFDVLLIRFLYGEINIDSALVLIRIVFDIFFTLICILSSRKWWCIVYYKFPRPR